MFHKPTPCGSFLYTQIPGTGQGRGSLLGKTSQCGGPAVTSSFAHWSSSTSLVLVTHGPVDSRQAVSFCHMRLSWFLPCLPPTYRHTHTWSPPAVWGSKEAWILCCVTLLCYKLRDLSQQRFIFPQLLEPDSKLSTGPCPLWRVLPYPSSRCPLLQL